MSSRMIGRLVFFVNVSVPTDKLGLKEHPNCE
jgi:hypothetical protein